jgi:hypothetical protein
MNKVKYVDNVILDKVLFNLYRNLFSHSGWNLTRSSTGESLGNFPGFVVKDNNQVYNNYWDGYFTSLYERIKINFYEKYKYKLPDHICRIHLGAKNENSMTEFHTDDANDAITVLGFLTPVWAKDWGGSLQVEENNIDFKPGKFLIFNSDEIHEGIGPCKKIPYWRISINYVIKNVI